jgi:lipopolysaccharide export system protein LptA
MKKEIIEEVTIEKKIKEDELIEKKNIISNLQYNVELENNGKYEIKSSSSEIIYEGGVEIVFMEDVTAIFTDDQNRKITVKSEKASFNSITYNTKFINNTKILYENHKITSDKIDFNFKDNNILISENVIYTGLNNEINTDNIKINLITKDVQFYMNSQNEKIKITSN